VCALEDQTAEFANEVEHDTQKHHNNNDIKIARPSRETISRQQSEQENSERVREVGSSDPVGFVQTGGYDGPPAPPNRRLLFVMLDGAAPELALHAWRRDLRTFDLLTERGAWCLLQSPRLQSPELVWQNALSGLDAGQLGIYSSRLRINRHYAPSQKPSSAHLRGPRLWDLLSTAGKHVGVVGAPLTTPVPRINGHVISDTPLSQSNVTAYPPSLSLQIATWLGDALLDSQNSSALQLEALEEAAIEQLIQQAYTNAEQRFLLARRLLAREQYDAFMISIDGLTSLQSHLWNVFDSRHPLYEAHHPMAASIGSFYRFIDDQLFELLEMVDDQTYVVIASVGGAQPLLGEFALNSWLIEQGDLVLLDTATEANTLDIALVDWSKTRAWSDADGVIYCNVTGREPQGIIAPAALDAYRQDLARRLRLIKTPQAQAAFDVYYPDELFSNSQGVSPDLIVSAKQAGWRISPLLSPGSLWLQAGTHSIDAAYPSSEGFMLLYDPIHNRGGLQLPNASVYDIVPTLLSLLNIPLPTRLRGRVIPVL
jgi:predicted AlkP superfamily phosphohydrolase/phosphomutase